MVFTTDPETLKEMAADVRKYRRAKLHEDAKINLPFTKNFKITLEQVDFWIIIHDISLNFVLSIVLIILSRLECSSLV